MASIEASASPYPSSMEDELICYLPAQLALIMAEGVELFNVKPSSAVAFLKEKKVILGQPHEFAKFIHSQPKLSKRRTGEFVGGADQFNQDVCTALFDLHPLSGLTIDEAIRHLARHIRLPGEAQQIDRILEKFSQCYYKQNPSFSLGADTFYVLSFSIIMLNTDLHNPSIPSAKKMTQEQFIQNNRGINNGKDVSRQLLTALYTRIKKHPIIMDEADMFESTSTTFMAPSKAGWLEKRGASTLLHTWQRRWFLLKDGCLYYFQSPADTSRPRGILSLDGVHVSRGADSGLDLHTLLLSGSALKLAKLSQAGRGTRPCKRQQMVLRAASDVDCRSWLDLLLAEIDVLQALHVHAHYSPPPSAPPPPPPSSLPPPPLNMQSDTHVSSDLKANTQASAMTETEPDSDEELHEINHEDLHQLIQGEDDSVHLHVDEGDVEVIDLDQAISSMSQGASTGDDWLRSVSTDDHDSDNRLVASRSKEKKRAVMAAPETSGQDSNRSSPSPVTQGDLSVRQRKQHSKSSYSLLNQSGVRRRSADDIIMGGDAGALMSPGATTVIHDSSERGSVIKPRLSFGIASSSEDIDQSQGSSHLFPVNGSSVKSPRGIKPNRYLSASSSGSGENDAWSEPRRRPSATGQAGLLRLLGHHAAHQLHLDELALQMPEPLMKGWLLFKGSVEAVWAKKYCVLYPSFDDEGSTLMVYVDEQAANRMRREGCQTQQKYFRMRNVLSINILNRSFSRPRGFQNDSSPASPSAAMTPSSPTAHTPPVSLPSPTAVSPGPEGRQRRASTFNTSTVCLFSSAAGRDDGHISTKTPNKPSPLNALHIVHFANGTAYYLNVILEIVSASGTFWLADDGSEVTTFEDLVSSPAAGTGAGTGTNVQAWGSKLSTEAAASNLA